ncbi:MAG: hypothetical protein QMD77_04955, partial [Patescibacteria group bacterium]|nr:hypothetical protein [Patescibacteria group bacterium]
MNNKKRQSILVFASGTKSGGGSGFQKMVEATRINPPVLDARICGVITNHFGGSVWRRAKRLGVHVEHWSGQIVPYSAEGY